MHELLVGNTSVVVDNLDSAFDGVKGVYHTIGIMKTHTNGTLLIEYRVRGHGGMIALPVVDLSSATLDPITFTAPVTEWKITVSNSDDAEGVVTVTDTQVKSSVGLVESNTQMIKDLDHKVNTIVQTPAIIILVDGAASVVTITHNFPYNPNVTYTDPDGRIGFADVQYLDDMNIKVSSVIPMLGKLTVK